jgi:hypothetical protein
VRGTALDYGDNTDGRYTGRTTGETDDRAVEWSVPYSLVRSDMVSIFLPIV